jgi:dsDNA-specific endonuclease/ATPase MutS2
MSTVAEKVKETYETARSQVNGFEKDLNKRIHKLEKKAKASLEDVKEQVNGVPDQLKGAWENVVTRLRSALAFATRDELETLTGKVDELAKKVEKLIRGDKIRSSATKK